MKILAVSLMAAILQAEGCETVTTDNKQARETQKIAAEADAQVGLPGVTQFTEKRLMRTLYEMRDKKIATHTYLVALDNKITKLCDSIGYGLPYGTQFTNPERIISGSASQTIPQPEPNGLFMPPSAEGTWVICVDKAGKEQPVYSEPRVIVSPFPLTP